MGSVNYHEKQFEVFIQDELRTRSFGMKKTYFAPVGQVVEAKVGYDLGVRAQRWDKIWKVLGVPFLPGRDIHSWNNNLAPDDAVSSRATNLFFQFKRPKVLHGARAAHLARFGGPYLRFKADRSANGNYPSQHELLEQLEQRSAGQALVRYAAPVCHDFAELEDAANRRRLLERTIFVEPSRFAPDHTACCYTTPHDAIVNPEPVEIEPETWPAFTQKVASASREAEGLREAVFGAFDWTATAFASDTSSRERTAQVSELPFWRELSGETRELVDAALTTSRNLDRLGLTWYFGLRAV